MRIDAPKFSSNREDYQLMPIARRDPLTGKVNQMNLPVLIRQFDAWENGMLIQHAFPQLSADEREFLMTGLMPDSWDAVTKPEDE
jgi:hypothetical protein